MKFREHRSRPASAFQDSPASAVCRAGAAPGGYSFTIDDTGLPAILTATAPPEEPSRWMAGARADVERLVLRHGALLFRGFGVEDAAGFERCIRALSGDLMDYQENTSPRSAVQGLIQTSTDHPASEHIVLHNEHSYSRIIPSRLFLFCMEPAREGGATPLADCRQVLARIDPSIVGSFQERGWLYVRNFVDGFGPDWRQVYQIEDRDTLEAYFRRAGVMWEWTRRGHLRTMIRRAAVALHPRTGEQTWFNHIAFWHITSLATEMQSFLRNEFAEADLPNNTYYGDGSAIEHEVIADIRAAYDGEARQFPWRRGDILVVDNMLCAHGRAPYSGVRQILFAMAEPLDRAAAPDWRT